MLLAQRRQRRRARCARRFPIAPSSIAAATACSAPAPRRCCARPRPATCRSSSCCSRRAPTRRRRRATASTRIMMAANVATREEDMTGRSKTQKDAIETITLLLAAGADINGADTQGRTALHGAALWGLTDVVRSCTRTARSSTSRTSAASRRSTPPWAGRRLRLRRQVGRRARGHGQGDSRAHGRSGRLRPTCAPAPACGWRGPQRCFGRLAKAGGSEDPPLRTTEVDRQTTIQTRP